MADRDKIIGIQYLRGIAAAAVVLDHASILTASENYLGKLLWGGWLEKGAIGVDLFFMISGFIIVSVSLQPDNAHARLSISEFYRRRAARILPLMWLAIAVFAVIRIVGTRDLDLIPYVRAAFVWPVGELLPNVIWTLRQEAVFYLLFGMTFLSREWLRLLLPVWGLAPFVYAAAAFPYEPTSWSMQLLRTLTHPTNIEFCIGAAAGLWWIKGGHRLALKIPLLFTASAIYLLGAIAVANVFDLRADRVPDTLVSALMFLPLLLLAIIGRGVPSRVGLLLGEASFAIYLFHPAVLPIVLKVTAKLAPGVPAWGAIALASAAGIGAGIIVHLLVEGRLNAWAQRLLVEKPTLRPAVVEPV